MRIDTLAARRRIRDFGAQVSASASPLQLAIAEATARVLAGQSVEAACREVVALYPAVDDAGQVVHPRTPSISLTILRGLVVAQAISIINGG